ncbi:MAG: hypothetical protein WC297_02440 [Candidatus Paceibacterota bacterium]|jgi:hypothetical protein
MPQGLKSFLRKIQNSDESVKKRYLLIFSIIAMAVVVGLWVLYLREMSSVDVAKEHEFSVQKVFSAVSQWSKDIIFKIREGRVINIER